MHLLTLNMHRRWLLPWRQALRRLRRPAALKVSILLGCSGALHAACAAETATSLEADHISIAWAPNGFGSCHLSIPMCLPPWTTDAVAVQWLLFEQGQTEVLRGTLAALTGWPAGAAAAGRLSWHAIETDRCGNAQGVGGLAMHAHTCSLQPAA